VDTQDNRAGSPWWSTLYGLGMLMVFTGERLIGAGSARWATALGVLLVVAATTARDFRRRRVPAEARPVERALLALQALGVVALALYFAQSDLFAVAFGKPLEHDWPRLSVALGVLYPALWLAAALPILFVELAYAAVARAPKLEAGRIHDALLSGLGLAGALVFAFCVAYVATQRDKKVDFSYFRTAKPGEATHKIVASLDAPLEISLFFPPANEVREEVAGYFADLTRDSKLLEVHSYDHDIDPAKAKELGVSGNGIVVVGKKGGRRELLSVGLELEAARAQLANLDKEVQKRMLQVARPGRTVYMTAGHGERTTEPNGDTDKRATVRDLRELLTQQGYAVRNLGAADGLAADVPTDAAIVMVLGPQKPLLPEENAALGRYLERGGRLFIAVDPDLGPEVGIVTKDLLGPLGLKLLPTVLASDQSYYRRSYQASDRGIIVTGSYSSHPSVTTIGRLGLRAPMGFVNAGALEEIPAKERPAGLTIDFPVRSHVSTWNDENGNFQFDPPTEKRKAWQLGAAVLRKKAGGKTADEMRTLVLGDSDAISDGIVGNPGNAYYVVDGVKWLLGDEAIAGETSSEVDTPVAHTRKQDVVWFYSSIFLAPVLALGAGILATRRRRSAKPKERA
jgi:hypothetical protein